MINDDDIFGASGEDPPEFRRNQKKKISPNLDGSNDYTRPNKRQIQNSTERIKVLVEHMKRKKIDVITNEVCRYLWSIGYQSVNIIFKKFPDEFEEISTNTYRYINPSWEVNDPIVAEKLENGGCKAVDSTHTIIEKTPQKNKIEFILNHMKENNMDEISLSDASDLMLYSIDRTRNVLNVSGKFVGIGNGVFRLKDEEYKPTTNTEETNVSYTEPQPQIVERKAWEDTPMIIKEEREVLIKEIRTVYLCPHCKKEIATKKRGNINEQ